MRFLFVYQDFAAPARQLLSELSVRDVTLVVATKNSDGPSAVELTLLESNRGAPAAAVQVTRKYRRSIAPLVKLECEPKQFRVEDQVLRAWLKPVEASAVQVPAPSVAVIRAVEESSGLVLAPGALNEADDVAHHRHQFVHHAAGLLAKYADGTDLGPLREWKSRHGVEFAANGRVSFSYEANYRDESAAATTEWHLKEGDRTTRESAARIYFERVSFPVSGAVKVIIFYVGPHPTDGNRPISITIEDS